METYRTSAQWQKLFQQRSHFSGTNVEFCQHHNVSITTYYKQRTLLTEGFPKASLPTQTPRPTASRFIQVKKTLKSALKLIKTTYSLIRVQVNLPCQSI